MIVDADRCTGCQVCELACSMTKYGEYNPKKSYIRLVRNREMNVNIVALGMQCDYCGKCVEACLPGAIKFVNLGEAAIIRKESKIGAFPAPVIGKDGKI